MTGEEFRAKAKEAGVYLWQVANEASISEPTLTRWLRGRIWEEREEILEAALQSAVRTWK